MKVQLNPAITIICPNCGEDSHNRIDYYLKRQLPYTYYGGHCNSCNRNFKQTIIHSADNVEVELDDTFTVKTFDLLVLQPQKKPVYFIVKGSDYSRGNEEPYNNKEYFYDEHTCPTNWIREVECIISEADDDPHGLFEYVRSVDYPVTDPSFKDNSVPPIQQMFTSDCQTERDFLQREFPEAYVKDSKNLLEVKNEPEKSS